MDCMNSAVLIQTLRKTWGFFELDLFLAKSTKCKVWSKQSFSMENFDLCDSPVWLRQKPMTYCSRCAQQERNMAHHGLLMKVLLQELNVSLLGNSLQVCGWKDLATPQNKGGQSSCDSAQTTLAQTNPLPILSTSQHFCAPATSAMLQPRLSLLWPALGATSLQHWPSGPATNECSINSEQASPTSFMFFMFSCFHPVCQIIDARLSQGRWKATQSQTLKGKKSYESTVQSKSFKKNAASSNANLPVLPACGMGRGFVFLIVEAVLWIRIVFWAYFWFV